MRSSELSFDAVAAPSTGNLDNRRSKLDGVDGVDQKPHVYSVLYCVHNLEPLQEGKLVLYRICQKLGTYRSTRWGTSYRVSTLIEDLAARGKTRVNR